MHAKPGPFQTKGYVVAWYADVGRALKRMPDCGAMDSPGRTARWRMEASRRRARQSCVVRNLQRCGIGRVQR